MVMDTEKDMEIIGKQSKINYAVFTILSIDHVIDESKRMFSVTEHADDLLRWVKTAWWTPEAKSYIEVNGFKDRQLRWIGDTSKGSRYQVKFLGPEFCRGLDAYGFSDFLDRKT